MAETSRPSFHSRHLPFYLAAAAGVVASLVALFFLPGLPVTASVDAFFLVYLGLVLWRVPLDDAEFLRRNAGDADEPAWIIFTVTLVTAFTALTALFVLVGGSGKTEPLGLVFGLASVPLGWFAIHTMASMHYGHLYWADDEDAAGEALRGIGFPGTDEPAGWDFLYFGFTIGATAQTSDCEITSSQIRRFVLGHAIASFVFNTVLVAATINVAVENDAITPLPQIYVDADACPVKDEVVRVAERHGLVVTFVSNGGLRPSRDPMIRHVVVSRSADAADDWIVEHAGANDIVVTADVPLAARAVAKGCHVLGPSGRAFTPDSIGMAVAMRDLGQHLRETGESKGYNAAFTPQDRSRFLSALDQAVRQALRSG